MNWLCGVGRHAGWMVVLLVWGCGSLSTDVPTRFDLNGEWLAESDSALPERSERRRNRRGDVGFDPASLPMLTAPQMIIEQNADSMGIAYPNGVYRDVSWGDRQRRAYDVSAGWDGPVLVIETKGPSYKMTERFALSDEGQLTVEISLNPDRGDHVALVRVYRRVGG